MTRRIPPLAITIGAALTQRLLAPAGPRSSAKLWAIPAAASATALVAPVVAFGRARTTVDPRAEATPVTLVTDGTNAISRNPMYLGMLGLLLTHALHLHSWRALAPAAAFALWIDRIQIPAEEHILTEQFGPTYAAYQRRTRRWIGYTRS